MPCSSSGPTGFLVVPPRHRCLKVAGLLVSLGFLTACPEPDPIDPCPGKTYLRESVPAQQNGAEGLIASGVSVSQSIKPSISYQLDTVEVVVTDCASQQLDLHLRPLPGTGTLASVTDVSTTSYGFEQTVTFTFTTQPLLSPGTSYYLELAADPSSFCRWASIRQISCPPDSVYSQGSANTSGIDEPCLDFILKATSTQCL